MDCHDVSTCDLAILSLDKLKGHLVGSWANTTAFAGVYNPICGSDIQLHSFKGAIGKRADGTQQMQQKDVYIHDVIIERSTRRTSTSWC